MGSWYLQNGNDPQPHYHEIFIFNYKSGFTAVCGKQHSNYIDFYVEGQEEILENGENTAFAGISTY